MSNPKKDTLRPLFENGDQPPQEDFWLLIERIFNGANEDLSGNSVTGIFLGNTQGTYHRNQFGAVFPVQAGFVVGGKAYVRVLPDEPIRITGAEIENQVTLDRLYAKNVTNILEVTCVRIDIVPVIGTLVPVVVVDVLNFAEVKDPGKTETFLVDNTPGNIDIDLSSKNENGELMGGFVKIVVTHDRATDVIYTLPALAGFTEGATMDFQVIIAAAGAAVRLRANVNDTELEDIGIPGVALNGGGDENEWVISSSFDCKFKKYGSEWLVVRASSAAQFEQAVIASGTVIGRLSANPGSREVITIADLLAAMLLDTAEAQPGQVLRFDDEFQKFIPSDLPPAGGASTNDNLLSLTYGTDLAWDLAGNTATPRLRAKVTTNGAMKVSPATFTNRPSGAFDFYLLITIGNTNDAVTLFPDTTRTQWNTSDLLPTNLAAGTKVLVVGYYDGADWFYTYSIGYALAGAAAPTGTASVSGFAVGGTMTHSHTFANTGGYTESGTITWARYYPDLSVANADTTGTAGTQYLAPQVTSAATSRTFTPTAPMLNQYVKYYALLRNNAGSETLVASVASQIVAASTGPEWVSTAISSAVGDTVDGFSTINTNITLDTTGAGDDLMAFFVVTHAAKSLSDGSATVKGFLSATYNGQALTLVDLIHNPAGSKAKVSVFQLLDASLPADGTYAFQASMVAPDLAAYAVVELVLFRKAQQATITKKAKAQVNSNLTMTFAQLTSVAANSLLVTFMGAGSGGSFFTANSGQTEVYDSSTPSAGGTNAGRALYTKQVAAGDYTESVAVGANSEGAAGIVIAIAPA